MQLVSAVLFAAPAAAWLSHPFLKSDHSSSWTPPQETNAARMDGPNIVEGWSPRPTTAPKPLFGRMNIEPRLDGYTLGPATCGFIRSNDHVIACSSAGMTCAFENGYAGCCVPNQSCSAVKRKCINYSQSKAGSCASSLLTDFHTVCCGLPDQGECFTWSIDLDGGDGRPSGGFTVYDCSSTAGRGTLLNYDPVWAATHVASSTEESSTSTTSESTSSTSSEATNTSDSNGDNNGDDNNNDGGNGGKKKTNVGAIAGGAVGGVAALGLIGAAIFLFMRRNKKKDGNNAAGSSPAAPMSQHTYSPPPQKQTPESAYPSGVPSQHGYPPQPYSPDMNAYNQQQNPQQPYSPPGFQQPYQQQHQYAPQQQWGAYGQPTSPSGMSPGAHTTPSPGFNTSPSPMGTAAHSPPPQPVSELGAVNPIGAESNRAELH